MISHSRRRRWKDVSLDQLMADIGVPHETVALTQHASQAQLTREEIERLMQMLGLTRDDELDCDRCLDLVAEFAETKLAGKSYAAGAKLVEHHLASCSECREEFRVLQITLDKLKGE
jgi:hypothetical protein